jgi:hypothetical protein
VLANSLGEKLKYKGLNLDEARGNIISKLTIMEIRDIIESIDDVNVITLGNELIEILLQECDFLIESIVYSSKVKTMRIITINPEYILKLAKITLSVTQIPMICEPNRASLAKKYEPYMSIEYSNQLV